MAIVAQLRMSDPAADAVQPEENQLAVIAGDKAADGVYQLPSQVATAAQAQYERDVARVHGGPVQNSEAEYRQFLSSLGGPQQGGGALPVFAASCSGRRVALTVFACEGWREVLSECACRRAGPAAGPGHARPAAAPWRRPLG